MVFLVMLYTSIILSFLFTVIGCSQTGQRREIFIQLYILSLVGIYTSALSYFVYLVSK